MTNEELVVAIRTEADKEIRDKHLMELYDQNRGILKIIYGRHFKSRMSWDDFSQESFIAMTKAIASYDAKKNRFISWYSRYVVWHVGRFWESSGTAIRLPSYVWDSLRAMDEQERMPLLGLAFQGSLNEKVNDDEAESITMLDNLSDPINYSDLAINKADKASLKQLIGLALADLPERSRDILQRRYGDCQTLEEVGDIYGISRERIRQIQSKAIRLVQTGQYGEALKSFVS